MITRLHVAGPPARRINLTLLVLKIILRTALRRRYLRDDPTETIRSLREPKAEVNPLDPEEVTAFLAAGPAWWRPYFTVASWTGAGPNELAALRWGDVDSGRGIVRIRAGRYRGKEGPPKTASSVRDIDLFAGRWLADQWCRRGIRLGSLSARLAMRRILVDSSQRVKHLRSLSC